MENINTNQVWSRKFEIFTEKQKNNNTIARHKNTSFKEDWTQKNKQTESANNKNILQNSKRTTSPNHTQYICKQR